MVLITFEKWHRILNIRSTKFENNTHIITTQARTISNKKKIIRIGGPLLAATNPENDVLYIPFGSHISEEVLNKKVDLEIDRTVLCSAQFSQGIYRNDVVIPNWVTLFEKSGPENYLLNMKKSMYVISPHGDYADCYRHWEAMYMGAIPITLKHPHLENYYDLPILFLDSWDHLSKELLESEYENILKRSKEKLNVSYWVNKVNNITGEQFISR